jgi:Putative peptidoglycan binding domain
MTKTTTVASKAFVAIVAAAMVFSLVAPAAKAATAEELQAQITALMAQISALQGGTTNTTTTTTTTSTCASIPAPLTMNASGASVTALQNFLIGAGQTIPAGATGFFGGQTKSALAAWQTANGVSPAAGYYGPVTAAAIAAKCVPTTPTTPGTTPTTPGTSADLQGEATLKDVTVDSASDDEVEEGQEDAEIAEITVEFEDGDAEISRLDLDLDGVTDVWDIYESVMLMVDGKEVASMDAADEDDYNDTVGTKGTLRFSGLSIVGMEDEELEIMVVANFQNGIDGADLGTYTVDVVEMRYFDADGVAETDPITEAAVNFTLQAEGADDELTVRTSTEDPDGTTLQVEDDKKSDWYTVFAFDIDTDESSNDIDLDTVVIDLLSTTTAGASYNTLVDDAELVIDGVTIDDVAVTGTVSANGTAVLTFDVDNDVTIDAGDRVKAELKLRFKSLALANEGATIKASIGTGDIDGEGADDVSSTGGATGDEHTLRSTGIEVALSEDSAVVTTGDSANDDYATYTLELDVTAFEQDVYIDTNNVNSLVVGIVDAAGAVVAGTSTVVLDSSADEVGGYFEITEGNTETVTIKVTFDALTAGSAARLQLTSIEFDDNTAAGGEKTWVATPATDYRTDIVTLVN